MRFDVLTLFPEFFSGYLRQPMIQWAQEQKIVSVRLHDFGAGAVGRKQVVRRLRPHGKVLRSKPILDCLNKVDSEPMSKNGGSIVILSPHGRLFTQDVACEFMKRGRLTLLCGRFSGFEPSLFKSLKAEEVSVGDFLLSGGESAAMLMMDTMIRLVPGVLKDE